MKQIFLPNAKIICIKDFEGLDESEYIYIGETYTVSKDGRYTVEFPQYRLYNVEVKECFVIVK